MDKQRSSTFYIQTYGDEIRSLIIQILSSSAACVCARWRARVRVCKKGQDNDCNCECHGSNSKHYAPQPSWCVWGGGISMVCFKCVLFCCSIYYLSGSILLNAITLYNTVWGEQDQEHEMPQETSILLPVNLMSLVIH